MNQLRFIVGDDIEPGTYRGNVDGGSCYWARLSGTSGDFDDLIANDNVAGPTVVTIPESDVAFRDLALRGVGEAVMAVVAIVAVLVAACCGRDSAPNQFNHHR